MVDFYAAPWPNFTLPLTHRNEYGDPVEEYEIQFIDGDNHQLFSALGVNQANLKQWFDDYQDLEDEELIKAIYLVEDQHCDMNEILDKLEDVCLFEGTAEDYTDSYIEDTGLLDQIPENLQYYFNRKAFARDMLINGDITELRVDNTDYIVWGV